MSKEFDPTGYCKAAQEVEAHILEQGELSHTDYMQIMGPAVMCATAAKESGNAATHFPENMRSLALRVSELAIRLPENHPDFKKMRREAVAYTSRIAELGFKNFVAIGNEVSVYDEHMKKKNKLAH